MTSNVKLDSKSKPNLVTKCVLDIVNSILLHMTHLKGINNLLWRRVPDQPVYTDLQSAASPLRQLAAKAALTMIEADASKNVIYVFISYLIIFFHMEDMLSKSLEIGEVSLQITPILRFG